MHGALVLRDLFQFLMTLLAVIRSDSLYKANLCYLCNFMFHQPGEHDPYYASVLTNGAGKSIKDKTQFGKVMYHKVPELCLIKALDFLLLARIGVTQELDGSDFLDNESWFNTKLLISTQAKKEK